jgi:N-acylneuraminate cytidylyltransferase
MAIVPARGGSKRIPRKNLVRLAGLPLLAHSILHARQSRFVREVYVSTEDEEIAEVAHLCGALVMERPLELAGDEATSESALLHVLDERLRGGLKDPDLVVFLQCTSPVRRPYDIDRAVETLLREKADSLFSACENKHFIWTIKDGGLQSVNYDYRDRQREQDMAKQYRENGSIYVFRPAVLRQHNNRLGGKMAVYEMDYWSSFQVDTTEDLDLIDWILRRPDFRPPVQWPRQVALLVFDFDGVMTDNTAWVTSDGRETVRCHRGDGWAIAEMNKAGVPMLVLSTETDPVVATRCAKLKLSCHQGIGDKATYLAGHLKENNIESAQVIFVGNDLSDLDCMRMVGCSVAPADAHPSVLAVADIVLRSKGGNGAVREFYEMFPRKGNRNEESDVSGLALKQQDTPLARKLETNTDSLSTSLRGIEMAQGVFKVSKHRLYDW